MMLAVVAASVSFASCGTSAADKAKADSIAAAAKADSIAAAEEAAAAAAARYTIEIMRVFRFKKVGGFCRGTHGKLIHVCLA